MVTDEMVDKAADEMARQDIMFANCDRGWQKRTIRAALEAALSATEPAGFTLEMKTSLSSNWFRDFSFEPLKENDFVRNVRPVYAAPPAPPVAEEIADAVLSWMVEYDLLDAGNEYRAADVVTVLDDFKPSYHAALSAQVQDVAGWQPIETAPKDGTRLLLMWEPFSGMSEHVELGKWNVRNGWVNTYGHAFSGSPTHFMPLPAAPAKQEG